MRRPSLLHGSLLAVAALALAACSATSGDGAGQSASADPDADLGTLPVAVPLGEVLGQGTVLDDGTGPELCLGGVAESFPPQCDGPPIDGWDWDAFTGWTDASGVRWGEYAVQGTFDGERIAVTADPISLALYDPMPIEEEPLAPGTTDEDVLGEIQLVLADALGERALGSWTEDGRLEQSVVYDDGSLQEHLDEVYGPNVVHVVSALRDVSDPEPSAAPMPEPDPTVTTDMLPAPAIPAGEVTIRGLVVDAGTGPGMCLGDIAAIAPPPACAAPPVVGLDWTSVASVEELNGVRWATLDLQGTYDGATLTLTQSATLVDMSSPQGDGGPPPFLADPPTDELIAVQDAVIAELGDRAILALALGDAVVLTVLYDDGSLQAYLDARHGEGVVEVAGFMSDVES